MMNVIEVQDGLKNFSEQQLIKEMQQPSGNAPQFLVLSELNRRKRVKGDYEARQSQNQQTVAQDAVASAGVPQEGMMGMSEAMAPASAESEGIGSMMPKSMRNGGEVDRYADGGLIEGIAESVGQNSEMLQQVAQNMGKMNTNTSPFPQPSVQLPPQQPSVSPINSTFRPPLGGQVTDMAYRGPFNGFGGSPFNRGGQPLGFGGKGGQRAGRDTYGRPSELDSTFKGLGSFADIFNKVPAAEESKAMAEGGIIRAANGASLADRNYNPGNIRKAGFIGETGENAGYSTYASPEFGLRALSRLSNTYNDKGISTVRDFINRYAPTADNNKNNEQYAKMVAGALGVGIDDPVDFSNDAVKQALIPAIAQFEGYTGDTSPDLINKGIAASKTEDVTKVNELLSGIDSLSGDKSGGEKLGVDLAYPQTQNFGLRGKTDSNQEGFSIFDIFKKEKEIPDPDDSLGNKVDEKTFQMMSPNEKDFVTGKSDPLLFGYPTIEAGPDTSINNSKDGGFPAFPDPLFINRMEQKRGLPGRSNQDVYSDGYGEQSDINFLDTISSPIIKKGIEDRIKRGQITEKQVEEANKPGDPAVQEKKFADEKKNTEKFIEEKKIEEQKIEEKKSDSKSNYTFADGSPSKGISSTEQEILDLQRELKKDRDFDRYMALAQVGLNLMDQKGYGEAMNTGLKTFGDSKKRYSDAVTSLINARAKLKTATDKGTMTTKEAYDKLNDVRERIYGKQGDLGAVTIELKPEELAKYKAEEQFLLEYMNKRGFKIPVYNPNLDAAS